MNLAPSLRTQFKRAVSVLYKTDRKIEESSSTLLEFPFFIPLPVWFYPARGTPLPLPANFRIVLLEYGILSKNVPQLFFNCSICVCSLNLSTCRFSSHHVQFDLRFVCSFFWSGDRAKMPRQIRFQHETAEYRLQQSVYLYEIIPTAKCTLNLMIHWIEQFEITLFCYIHTIITFMNKARWRRTKIVR